MSDRENIVSIVNSKVRYFVGYDTNTSQPSVFLNSVQAVLTLRYFVIRYVTTGSHLYECIFFLFPTIVEHLQHMSLQISHEGIKMKHGKKREKRGVSVNWLSHTHT